GEGAGPRTGLGAKSDLFSKIFQGTSSRELAKDAVGTGSGRLPGRLTPKPPVAPLSLAESGLSLMQVCDLVLKQLYLQGATLGVDLARQMRLPFNVVD